MNIRYRVELSVLRSEPEPNDEGSENAEAEPLRDWKVDRGLKSRPRRRVYATRIRLIV